MQPAPIECLQKCAFCAINSGSESLGKLLKPKIHVRSKACLYFVFVPDSVNAFYVIDNLMAVRSDTFVWKTPH